MSKTVVGLFEEKNYAEKAARQIKDQGLRTDDISIVARQGNGDTEKTKGMEVDETGAVNDNISDGVLSGGLLGGAAGLLLGAGSIAIPGLGIVAAAGPIAGMIAGTATGGIAGGLVDLGIPEQKSREYESNIKEGKVLFSMIANEDKTDSISSILKDCGARSVEIH